FGTFVHGLTVSLGALTPCRLPAWVRFPLGGSRPRDLVPGTKAGRQQVPRDKRATVLLWPVQRVRDSFWPEAAKQTPCHSPGTRLGRFGCSRRVTAIPPCGKGSPTSGCQSVPGIVSAAGPAPGSAGGSVRTRPRHLAGAHLHTHPCGTGCSRASTQASAPS